MSASHPRLDGAINAVMFVACVFTVLMMVHVTIDVFLRVVFNAPLTGTFEIVANYHMVAVMYLPLAYVTRNEGQIIVELFTRHMSDRKLRRWDMFVNAVTAIYVLGFTYYTGLMAIERTAAGEVKEMGDGFIDIWPARWILPVAFGLMAAYLVVRVGRDARAGDISEPPISA